MNSNNPLIGQFYFGYKQELVEVVAQVNEHFMLVAEYRDLHTPAVKRLVPLQKLQGYVLYPSKGAAFAAEVGGK